MDDACLRLSVKHVVKELINVKSISTTSCCVNGGKYYSY